MHCMQAGGGTLGRALNLSSVSHNTILNTVDPATGVNVNSADYEPYGDGPSSDTFA